MPVTAPVDQGCKLPPEGWWCSREPGHEGPCAARPLPTVIARGTPTPETQAAALELAETMLPAVDVEAPTEPPPPP